MATKIYLHFKISYTKRTNPGNNVKVLKNGLKVKEKFL